MPYYYFQRSQTRINKLKKLFIWHYGRSTGSLRGTTYFYPIFVPAKQRQTQSRLSEGSIIAHVEVSFLSNLEAQYKGRENVVGAMKVSIQIFQTTTALIDFLIINLQNAIIFYTNGRST